MRKLKDPCPVCAKPLDPNWKICPFCEAEVGAPPPPTRRTRRRRETTSSERPVSGTGERPVAGLAEGGVAPAERGRPTS
jgi:hypothetical protein